MKVINQVMTTNDYELFKELNGNRIVNQLHVERLKKSMDKKYLISPIIVNENYQVIDGQHRFQAAKDLGLSINFIIVDGYGLEEVQALNTNSKNWKKEDYLNAYCDLNYNEYLKMRQFMNLFLDFGISVCEQLLTNSTGGSNNKGTESKINGKYTGKIRNFQNGQFKVVDLPVAYENAEKIMMFKPYYEGFNRAVFVAAMIGIFKNENYDHAKMIHKLESNPNSLTHCNNVSQYKTLIEEIFNFRSRQKVSLKY